jgi:tyrosine-protein phosphatase SIW14
MPKGIPLKILPSLLVAGLSVLLGCSRKEPPSPQAAKPPSKPHAERIPGVPGLDNFARVNSALYRGAQPTEEGFRQLKALGVRTVIDFRSYHTTKKQVEAAGLTAVEIPLKADLGSVPPDEEAIRKFFEVVLDPARQPVYIHCAFGKDRTGTMAAIYRLEVDGWTPDEAIEEMQAFGYHTIYHELINFVHSYHARGYSKPR